MHKLEKFSANPGKLHFEGLVHLLKYIRDNKTLGLKYYANIDDAPVSTYWDKLVLKLRISWWIFLILVGKIFQKIAKVQEHKLYFIKVCQLTMAQIFQDQLLN